MNKTERLKTPDKIDVGVIGAGIIGLAVARSFALQDQRVFVFEAEGAIGTQTSSRNSEVIHSGIYYKTPLKSKLCVEGRTALYTYCDANQIPHKQVGKLVVATTEGEIGDLERLKQQGESNGVDDLEWLDASEISRLEPGLKVIEGLYSPSSGIIDSHAFMRSLRADLMENEGHLMTSTEVIGGEVRDDGIALYLGDSDDSVALCSTVVNCAGLLASETANSIDGIPTETVPQTYFAKGHYFTAPNLTFNHLIYPVPTSGGLGIHVTIDLEGNVKFGPDVVWVDDLDYRFDEGRTDLFLDAIKRYFPLIEEDSLQPGYTGIRPKIVKEGEQDGDFIIQGPKEHGVSGLVNLFGIESPGLTSSLAIAEHVRSLI